MKKHMYKQVTVKDHPYANQKGCVYEHRLMAEKKIGRYLLPEWRVHHINKNRQDNRPENLMVFASDQDHSAFHAGYRDFVEIVPGVLKAKGHVGPKDVCPICSKIKWAVAAKCRACDNKLRREEFLRKIPSLEMLSHELTGSSYRAVAKKYGVTDNTVRRWVKTHGKDPKLFSKFRRK